MPHRVVAPVPRTPGERSAPRTSRSLRGTSPTDSSAIGRARYIRGSSVTVGADAAAASPPTVGLTTKGSEHGRLGARFCVKLVAAIVGIGLAVFLGFLLLDRLVYRFGVIAAIVVRRRNPARDRRRSPIGSRSGATGERASEYERTMRGRRTSLGRALPSERFRARVSLALRRILGLSGSGIGVCGTPRRRRELACCHGWRPAGLGDRGRLRSSTTRGTRPRPGTGSGSTGSRTATGLRRRSRRTGSPPVAHTRHPTRASSALRCARSPQPASRPSSSRGGAPDSSEAARLPAVIAKRARCRVCTSRSTSSRSTGGHRRCSSRRSAPSRGRESRTSTSTTRSPTPDTEWRALNQRLSGVRLFANTGLPGKAARRRVRRAVHLRRLHLRRLIVPARVRIRTDARAPLRSVGRAGVRRSSCDRRPARPWPCAWRRLRPDVAWRSPRGGRRRHDHELQRVARGDADRAGASRGAAVPLLRRGLRPRGTRSAARIPRSDDDVGRPLPRTGCPVAPPFELFRLPSGRARRSLSRQGHGDHRPRGQQG